MVCPPHVNPPDFMLDSISGDSHVMSIDDMVQRWKDHVAAQQKKAVATDDEPAAGRIGQQPPSGTVLAR